MEHKQVQGTSLHPDSARCVHISASWVRSNTQKRAYDATRLASEGGLYFISVRSDALAQLNIASVEMTGTSKVVFET